jgi:hypothetical protein
MAMGPVNGLHVLRAVWPNRLVPVECVGPPRVRFVGTDEPALSDGALPRPGER